MKIVADDKIPFLKGVFERENISIKYLAGAKTTNADIIDADALITRTRTRCNSELLAGSSVRFIATATIGFDHIDLDYVQKQNIFWTNAPGCNSSSVAQYMTSLLLNLAVKHQFSLRKKTLGVVGVGHVGKKVAAAAEALGMKVLLNDPPRARAEGADEFVEINDILAHADIITLHVPLEYNGSDRTFHLADSDFIAKMRPHQFLVNASRGEVVDNNALKSALENRSIAGSVLDVWENEPDIDRRLLQLLDYATPHIAGYSTDGKANGTSMSVNALAEFFNLSDKLKKFYPDNVPLPEKTDLYVPENGSLEERLLAVVSASYDISEDTAALRRTPEDFEKLRGSYPLRREFGVFTVHNADAECRNILQKLGFKTA